MPRKIAGYGYIPDLADTRDRLYTLEEKILKPHQLPAEANLSAHMPPIYNQGQLGSCTGNGIARCLEYEAIRQGEKASTPSRLFIYYGEREIEGTIGQDSGAQIRDGIKVVATEGAPPETDWPYDVTRFADKPPASAYADAKKHEAIQYQRLTVGGPGAPLRTAIANGSPFVFGFSVPESFEDGSWDPSSDVLPLPDPNAGFIGGHCVVASGYDFSCTRFPMPAFQIENSWGSAWGMSGRFWMAWDWFDTDYGLASDLWVVSRVS